MLRWILIYLLVGVVLDWLCTFVHGWLKLPLKWTLAHSALMWFGWLPMIIITRWKMGRIK